MPRPIATGLTVADFERLGEDPDMLKHELIDGELFVTPRLVWRHQYVALLRIGRRLVPASGKRPLRGAADVRQRGRDLPSAPAQPGRRGG
jgi:hypothetical protein